jgi:uncharacterized protein (TIGR03437 family)
MTFLRLWLAVLAFFSLSAATFGRYVFVVPAGGSVNQMIGYTDAGQSMGTVATPAAPVAAFSNLGGTAAFVVTNSTNFALGVASIANNTLGASMTGISLEGFRAKAWHLSPTGGRLAVLAVDPNDTTGQRGSAFVLDANTGAFVSWRSLALFQQGVPQDVAFTNDGETLAVLTRTKLFFVKVEDGSILLEYNFGRTLSDPAYLSVGPNGSVYVTSVFQLYEFAGRAPLGLFGVSDTAAWPGRLSFSPDGRYALTQDKRTGVNVWSATGFDLNVRDSTVGLGAGTPLGGVTIPVVGSNTAVPLDSVQIVNELEAIGFSSTTGRMYRITYPALTATEYNPASSVPITGITSVSITTEIPGSRALWYGIGTGLFRYDMSAGSTAPPIPSIAGPISAMTLPNPDTSTLSALRAYNGGQPSTPGAPLARPYYVRAFDNFGRPIFNAPVSVSVATGGAIITSQSTATNGQGYAWAQVTAPTTAGEFTVTFNVAGRTINVTSGTASGGGGGGGGGTTPPPTGAGLRKIEGDGAIRQILDATLLLRLKVRAVGSDNKPLAGRSVTWTEVGGVQFVFSGGTFGSSVTDADGYATVEVLLTGTVDIFSPIRNYQVTAASEGVGTATFGLIGFPFNSGATSSAPIGFIVKPEGDVRNFRLKLGETLTDALRVAVASSGGSLGFVGAAIPGAAIRLISNNLDPNIGPVISCAGDYVLTATDGVASCDIVAAGKIGSTYFNIDLGWGHQVFSTFYVTVDPGDPVAPEITNGNNQKIKPGEDAPQTLTAVIKDAGGNLLQGKSVSWEVVQPGSLTLFNTISTSDFNGRVSTRVRGGPNAGTFQVRVKITGTTLEAIFTITVENVVSGFSKVSGDNQPTVVTNTQFPNPLVVLVYDQANRPLPNIQVNFQVTQGSATVSPAVATTNANGQASVTVTAGSTAGAITVQATLQNFVPITWSLNSRLPGPVLTTQSFTNFATGEVGVVPGSLVLISGPGIAPTITGERNANMTTAQLPYNIEGVTVEFRFSGRSEYAPLMRVANLNGVESALVQAPYDLAGLTSVDVRVVSGGEAIVNGVPVRSVGPGILEDTLGGSRAAIAIRSDGLRVTPSTPARRGEVIRLYVIGLGQTTPTAETNRVGIPDQRIRAAISVGIDDKGVTPMSAHLAENLIAIYEVVFRVPTDATIGNTRPLGLVIEPSPGQQFYANGSTIAISAQ